ncbi:hypothetical protein [Sporosarcina sp. A2]|uniref:hypothetical protein n=1 Tax=Sporosarcina sp. A2 TaxID=3393449 RepID=UPI003D7BE328
MKNSISALLMLCIVLLIGIGAPISASADYFANTRSFYGVSYHSSVDTKFTDGGVTYSYRSLFDEARPKWHNKAPGVNLTRTTHTWSDTYYVGSTSDPTMVGRIFPYNGSYDNVGLDAYWLYVNVYVYHNKFNEFKYSKAKRLATMTHEVGHSVKMKHPASYTGSSVMHQGPAKATSPTTWDINELNKKW